MRKAVIISSNESDDYLFYVPIVIWLWDKLGWDVVCKMPKASTERINFVINQPDIKLRDESRGFTQSYTELVGVESATQYQCLRLYAANYCDYDYLLLSDADMIPLSNYWHPNYNAITSYGRDLTDFHFPICYIGMPVEKWKEVMMLTGNTKEDLQRDLNIFKNHWGTDQDIITERLNKRNDVVRVDRGINPETGYPIGRIDRSAWDKSLKQKERIDAHLFRRGYEDENFIRIMHLIINTFNPSKDEIDWLNNYRNEYCKLITNE